jgi:hypothetical protein
MDDTFELAAAALKAWVDLNYPTKTAEKELLGILSAYRLTVAGGSDLTVVNPRDTTIQQLYRNVVSMEMRDDALFLWKFGDNHRVYVQLEYGDVVTFRGTESTFVDTPF